MNTSDAARRALRIFSVCLRVLLRGLGWAFLIVVLLSAGLGGYAYKRFSPEQARRIAVEQLGALLHRGVVIDRLVLTPRGIKIRGLRVLRGRAGGEGDLLTCDSVVLTVKLKPLLHRRLEFDSVRLQSPQISLFRDVDGSWSLADVFGSSATARRGTLPLALVAAEMVIEDGVLRVDDRVNGRKAVLEKFYLKVDEFDTRNAFPVETSLISAVSFGTRTVTTSLEAEGAVDLEGMTWSSATAHAFRLKAMVEGLEVSGTAEATSFAPLRVDADLSTAALGPDRWKRLAGRAWPLSLPAARWKLKASMPAPGMLELEQAQAQTPAGKFSATGIVDFAGASPDLSLEVSGQDIDVAQVAAWYPPWGRRSPAGRANIRASLTGWPGRLQAREGELSLRGFGSSWGDRTLSGVDLDASAEDEFSKMRITVTQGKAVGFGATFTDLSSNLTLKKQDLAVDRLTFHWGGSKVSLRARVANISAPKEVVLSGSFDKLRWEDAQRLVLAVKASISTRTRTAEDDERPWVRTFKYAIPRGFPDTVGRVRVGELTQADVACRDLDLLWALRGVTQDLDKVSGEARMRIGSGHVSDVPALQGSHKILRVIFLPFVFMHKMNNLSVFSAATAYPKTLDFSRIEGEYAVSKGVALTRYFHVDSAQLVAYADGTADFAHEKVDMNILTRLTSYRGTLPEWWVDEAGRPAIGFRVKGDLSNPDLEPRFKKIGEGEIERLVEEGRARAKKRFEALEKIQAL